MKDFNTGKKVFLRNVGKDEKWLQDVINKDPSLLPFENLVVVSKERRQSSGGKLDFLMKSEIDNSMYEVEIMLGATDESHIIRCIEYWDIEKRKFPQRQHYAVLIAESFTRRYFNIIQLFSLNIPMVAVQLDVIETENNYTLNFTKIMDIYEEADDEAENTEASESDWTNKAPWVINVANNMIAHLQDIETNLTLNYTQSYVAITKSGANQFYLKKRAHPKFTIGLRVSDQELSEKIKNLLENKGESYECKGKNFEFGNVVENEKLASTIHEIQKLRIDHKQAEAGEDMGDI